MRTYYCSLLPVACFRFVWHDGKCSVAVWENVVYCSVREDVERREEEKEEEITDEENTTTNQRVPRNKLLRIFYIQLYMYSV